VHAIAIDYFSRTAGTGRRPDGFEYEEHVKQLGADGINADIAAAVAFLLSRDGGAAERVYTVGFCIGGRISFVQAAMQEGLAGVIGFYGWPIGEHRSGLPSPAALADQMACPVLALWGGADRGIGPDVVAEFERALQAADVEHRSITYPDAPHSFFDRTAADYANESEDAWRQMLDFIGIGRQAPSA
jgi:carboxymethylenebutenolidase